MAVRPRLATRHVLAFAAATAIATALAGPVAAADPVLPKPTATVDFLQAIEFEGDIGGGADVARVEIVIDTEGSSRSFVAPMPFTPQPGTEHLGYALETGSGSLFPNTAVTAHFRATMADGRRVDGPAVTVQYEDTRLDWQTLKGELVTVHWTQGGTDFARRALDIGETAVRNVSDLLGVTESDPIDFYVYADRQQFYDVLGPGARENVGGEAHPDIRTLFANISPDIINDPWVGVVIPHELTHLVFDTAVHNPYHFPPRWLNEGLAVYESEGYGSTDRGDVRAAVRAKTLMPLEAIEGQFPTTRDQFFLAYSESVSAVDFLIRTYGQDALVTLIRSYAQGVTDDDAFSAALGVDVRGFEAAWLADLGADPPTPYGPVDAPAGPVPPGWTTTAPIPSRVPGRSGEPAPTAAPTPGGRDDGGATYNLVLSALVAFGLAIAGAALWKQRRDRARAELEAEASAGATGWSAPTGWSTPTGWSASTPMTADPPLEPADPVAGLTEGVPLAMDEPSPHAEPESRQDSSPEDVP